MQILADNMKDKFHLEMNKKLPMILTYIIRDLIRNKS